MLVLDNKNYYFCTLIKHILRGGAEVARRAHNPKVASSNLAPATKIACLSFDRQAIMFLAVTK